MKIILFSAGIFFARVCSSQVMEEEMIPIRELSEEMKWCRCPAPGIYGGSRWISVSYNITGFEKQENAIMVMDLPEGNFYSNAADFNRNAFGAGA